MRVHENIITIGDPSETDMPDRRQIGDRHASADLSETNMPAESNTYLFRFSRKNGLENLV